MLEKGEKAPDFNLKDAFGNLISLSQFLGKKVVVYFYPKDDTPGCTRQACAFRDSFQEFESLDIKIIGISADSQDSHKSFEKKYNLPFILLSDEDMEAIKSYGCWVEKKNFGKTYFGIQRATFIINEEGIVEKRWKNAKPDTNAQDILKYIKNDN